MEQLNRIELRGTVGSVRRQSFNGRIVVHFTMVTNFVYKVKDTEAAIETVWHNVTAWEGKDMPDLQLIEKGSKLYVVGRLKAQRYTDNEGIERVSTEVAAKRISLIDASEPLVLEQ